MAIKKEAFLRVGGFNTNLKLNEDIEISHRLSKIGKIILDSDFKVKTSGRRYRNGLILGLITYCLPTISRVLFKKYDKFQRFPPVRKEEVSLLGKISFPILSFFIFLFLIFHFSTPKIVNAKNFIAKNFNRVNIIESKIKNDLSKVRKLKFKNERNLYYFRRWSK
jgi:hypothetical protein